jgi:hypothetical protein
MAVAEVPTSSPAPGSFTEMERLLAEQVRLFCAKCDPLLERGYREIIRGTAPTDALLQRHRSELHWALRSARLYSRLTSAQDFSDRSLAELLAAKLRQLEEHWKYLFEPPSQEESDLLRRMIQKAFPDESPA